MSSIHQPHKALRSAHQAPITSRRSLVQCATAFESYRIFGTASDRHNLLNGLHWVPLLGPHCTVQREAIPDYGAGCLTLDTGIDIDLANLCTLYGAPKHIGYPLSPGLQNQSIKNIPALRLLLKLHPELLVDEHGYLVDESS